MSDNKDIKELNMNVKVNQHVSKLRESLINFVVPIVALVVTLLSGLLVLRPSYTNLPSLQSELATKASLESNLRAKLENLNRLVDFKSVVDENSDLVNRALVSEQLVPALLTQIDRIAQESGLTLSRLNYAIGSTEGLKEDVSYEFVTVSLGVRGNFSQLQLFLTNIENAARIVNVDTFRYSIAVDEDGNDSLGINFVLISPYLFVESTAVTDEPIDLEISDTTFLNTINAIKNMRYYDPNFVDETVPVVEVEEEEIAESLEDGQEEPQEESTEVPQLIGQ